MDTYHDVPEDRSRDHEVKTLNTIVNELAHHISTNEDQMLFPGLRSLL